MKRLLALGGASLLVLTACASGTKSAPQGVDAALHVRHPSVTAIAAARERKAGRKAEKLLHRVVLPRGARRTREPADVPALSRSGLGTSMLVEFAERHGFWRVHAPLATVMAFAKSHPLSRFDQPSSAGPARGERPVWRSLDFDGPVVGGRPMQRMYTITAIALHGSTLLRIDAGAAWIYPRSPREVVPAGVRKIEVRDEDVHRLVTDPAKVRRIVDLFDELNVAPPGHMVICGANISSRAKFVFRSATGMRLATAIVRSQPGDGCNPILFSIRGRRQMPLVDAVFGRRAFVNRVQRLLGLRLPER